MWYNYIKLMQIIKKCANNFSIEIRFWVEDLKVKYNKNYIDRSKIYNKRYTILWSFETYSRILVKLKAIKYKKDFSYYLSSYPNLDL